MSDDHNANVFNSHWDMRNIIYLALDTMEAAEETSPTKFRLVLHSAVKGFITSRLGKCSEATLESAVNRLTRYASRPKKSQVAQLRMARFVTLMESAEEAAETSSGAVSGDDERWAIKINLTGMPLATIEMLECRGPEDFGCRLYQSEVNEGYGIVVFDDLDSYMNFREWFFREHPGITHPLWLYI